MKYKGIDKRQHYQKSETFGAHNLQEMMFPSVYTEFVFVE